MHLDRRPLFDVFTCIRHKTKPWCSYRTVSPPIEHNDNPTIFVREEFPKVFPLDATIVACP